ncbi:DUF4270 domain-containing protein [Tannerella sp.]|uniref:DUF4270 domain-containing protein n=1 Tax=Tannerella sp. TaxID=2382127 RepID=UPI0026DD1906|nr:DUF4270 domain-containing protein [Tannerella sp.]MDO4702545.1 DUF4270 domain-containing protein [Tannerella sp.]
MKIKYAVSFLLLGGISLFSGCNDDLTLVGSTIQPQSDRNTVYIDTFQIKASTVKRDSLYAKTTKSLLGEIYDPLYGHLKSDYLCQFYCAENYQFPHKPHKGVIDSVKLKIRFSFWKGDGHALMRARVYAVNKPLEKNHYTNLNPADYSDMQNALGTQVYTAFGCFSDSFSIPGTRDPKTRKEIRIAKYSLNIALPKELGARFYNETVNNPSSFATQDAFNRFFPGLYIMTDYGSGNILDVSDTQLYFYYQRPKSSKNDTLIRDSVMFQVTKEVIQHTRFQNTDEEKLLEPNDQYAFVKTPAGIYPRLVIPTREIAKTIKDRFTNSLMFSLKYEPQENWKYAVSPPPHLMLMPEDSLRTFFENRSLENNVTTFLSTDNLIGEHGYNATTRTYHFRNIISLLNVHIKEKPDEDLRLLVVPVERDAAATTDGYGNPTGYYTRAIHNYLMLSGIKIPIDQKHMKIVVLSSKYHTGK